MAAFRGTGAQARAPVHTLNQWRVCAACGSPRCATRHPKYSNLVFVLNNYETDLPARFAFGCGMFQRGDGELGSGSNQRWLKAQAVRNVAGPQLHAEILREFHLLAAATAQVQGHEIAKLQNVSE